MIAYTLFDTPIGRCGLAWGARGIVGLQLPEARDRETAIRLLRRFPDAHSAPPPPELRRTIDAVAALLAGEPADLSAAVLDMEAVAPFDRRVYGVARTIAAGSTLTYGEVAARLGAPGAARAVGQALGRNPYPIVVPCHRVLAADGRLGGFSAPGGLATKLRLLSIERAQVQRGLLDGGGVPGFDPVQAMAHLRARDPALGRLMDEVGPFRMRVDTRPTVFAALAEAIVYQQLTGKAAATIFARLCALFPRAHEELTPRHVLRAPDDALRAAGLSASKRLSLRDLARRAAAGKIPTLAEASAIADEALVERLTQVRGVGRWTVEMLLIFRLGRPDVLPLDDYGIRKGFASAFRTRALPTRRQLEARGRRWKPYRTVASWYLWRAAERARPSRTR